MLRALPLLPVGDAGVPLLHDAIRTNDTRLVAAALGPYARHLDDAAWRQAVLKCVFIGVPLAVVHDLDERADAELAADARRAGRGAARRRPRTAGRRRRPAPTGSIRTTAQRPDPSAPAYRRRPREA